MRDQKAALDTGASSGIGQAIALLLSSRTRAQSLWRLRDPNSCKGALGMDP
jgi:NAD(P)-dependent dehydrogenase (short-subunit alcohol dehydrogenase family)